jgi:hypothetical protein
VTKKKLGIVGLVVAVVATVALAGGSYVLAQSPTATPQTETATPADGTHGMRGGMMGRGWGRELGSSTERAAVAEALGMTSDELATELQAGKTLADLAEEKDVDLQALYDAANQARETAWTDAIEQAVTDGDMTRAKADWLIEGQKQGYNALSLGRGLGDSRSSAERDAIAKALGLTTEQYDLQVWGGRTLADLADRAGVALKDVQAAAKTAREATLRTRIADALKAGDITQAQADWLTEGLDNGYMSDGQSMMGVGGGHGHGGGRGGMRGGMGSKSVTVASESATGA